MTGVMMDEKVIRLHVNMAMQFLSCLCFIALSQFRDNQKSLNHVISSLNQVLSCIMQLYQVVSPTPLIGDKFLVEFNTLAGIMRACKNYSKLNDKLPDFSGNCNNCKNFTAVDKSAHIVTDLYNCKKYKCNSLKFLKVGDLEPNNKEVLSKNCDNCKHRNKKHKDYPCSACSAAKDVNNRWEPI